MPRLPIRTSNPHEQRVIEELIELGYEVYKRGWPDLIAVRGDEVRLIEVKRPGLKSGLKPHQYEVAQILAKVGLKVELARGTLSRIDLPEPE